MGLLALPGLLLAPSGAPLDADSFHAPALPAITIDIDAPHDVAAVDRTAPMVRITDRFHVTGTGDRPGAHQMPSRVGARTSAAARATSVSSNDDRASGMSRGARIVVVLLALVAAGAFGTFVVLTLQANAAAKLRRARAAARAAE